MSSNAQLLFLGKRSLFLEVIQCHRRGREEEERFDILIDISRDKRGNFPTGLD